MLKEWEELKAFFKEDGLLWIIDRIEANYLNFLAPDNFKTIHFNRLKEYFGEDLGFEYETGIGLNIIIDR